MDNLWSNLAKVIYRRTYSRLDKNGQPESWEKTVERVIRGNTEGFKVDQEELRQLEELLLQRKAMPAGRGLWFSGSSSHSQLGGAALNNCWYLRGDQWHNLVIAQDLLMLGGGVGFSVEKHHVESLPPIRSNVEIRQTSSSVSGTFVVPDSREGWCELISRTLESYFETGTSFSYSTDGIRPHGSPIRGFGGTASGPGPLIACVSNIQKLLTPLAGKKVRPIHLLDLICMIGEMVVSGNVRRSAILVLGDISDKEFLKAKRWDLQTLPSYRAMANLSVVANRPDDLTPEFWETYQNGEPFGIVNRDNLQRFGRMNELKADDAEGVNPCAEATLTHAEPCNLQEIFLPRLKDQKEFLLAARLMHRWGKRVTCEKYHWAEAQEAVSRYRRIGTGITGCLQSSLFQSKHLDEAYEAIQRENETYSQELGIPPSIRTTVIKPSGTLSLMGDCLAGIHPAYSRYFIRRVRFSQNDPLIPALKKSGHFVEAVKRLDGTSDPYTVVADFYGMAPPDAPIADENWSLSDQLETVLFAQRHWADQAVSVTVYYREDEIPFLKSWLKENMKEIKTISFLKHQDHGFQQAPLEGISKETYENALEHIQPLDLSQVSGEVSHPDPECEGSACPVR